jgi:hypothetical protein
LPFLNSCEILWQFSQKKRLHLSTNNQAPGAQHRMHTILFHNGPLGMELSLDRSAGVPRVKAAEHDSPALLVVGRALTAIEGVPVGEIRDKKSWLALVAKLQAPERPLSLSFENAAAPTASSSPPQAETPPAPAPVAAPAAPPAATAPAPVPPAPAPPPPPPAPHPFAAVPATAVAPPGIQRFKPPADAVLVHNLEVQNVTRPGWSQPWARRRDPAPGESVVLFCAWEPNGDPAFPWQVYWKKGGSRTTERVAEDRVRVWTAPAPAPAPAPSAPEAPAAPPSKTKRRRIIAEESDDDAAPPAAAPEYKGVTETRPGSFQAKIYDKGPHHLGMFPTALAAARAYDREARLRDKEPNRRDVCDYCERPTVDADGDALADVLVCEECEAEAHLACANLGAVPADDWRCAQCVAQAAKAPKAPLRASPPPAAKPRAPSPRPAPAPAPASDSSSDDDDVNALRAKAAKPPAKKKRSDPLADLLADEKPKKKKKSRQRSDESTPSFDDVGGMALGRSTNGYASLGAVRSAFAAGRYGAQNTEFLQRFDAWLQREALPARVAEFSAQAHAAAEAWRQGRDYLLARDLCSDAAAADLRRVAALGDGAAGAEFLLAFAHYNALDAS